MAAAPFGSFDSSDPIDAVPSSAMDWIGEWEDAVGPDRAVPDRAIDAIGNAINIGNGWGEGQSPESISPESIDRIQYQYWLEHTRVPSSPRFHGQSCLDDTLTTLEAALQKGAIAAIKAPWGFDLVCDATNGEAVRRLRDGKGTMLPLALMVRNGAIARQYATVGELEAQALQQPGAPIVVLRAQPQNAPQDAVPDEGIAAEIRPSGEIAALRDTLGIMLPPNALYQKLLDQLDHPLMITSGNLAGGVPGVDNHQVRLQLGAIADYFLMNNQPVSHSVEASIVQVLSLSPTPEAKSSDPDLASGQTLAPSAQTQQLQVIRRSRGQASTLIQLPDGFEVLPPILAMGPTFDNTIALLRRNHAVLSRHLGHLDTASGLQAHQAALHHHRHLWNFDPHLVAVETHPDYHPTKLGREWHQDAHPTVAVQHHHAHLAACLVDNKIALTAAPVLALALDDFGYGDDGTLWGGELLWGSYQSITRLGSLRPMPLPASRLKRRHPWPWALTQTLTQSRPKTSSLGWLLGEVAVTMGLVRDQDSHGILLLEELARQGLSERPPITADLSPQQVWLNQELAYPFPTIAIARQSHQPEQASGAESIDGPFLHLDSDPMWQALMRDLRHRCDRSTIAAKLHLGLAHGLANWVNMARSQCFSPACQPPVAAPPTAIALTGSVFQNRLLLQLLVPQLQQQGLQVLLHRNIPMGDGGVALGQGIIAAAQYLERS